MFNLHLNGDIIRCPDSKAIQARVFENRELHTICKFGIKERECEAWSKYQMLLPRERLNKRCTLCNKGTQHYKITTDDNGFIWKIYTCPKLQSAWFNGIKQKNFKIDNPVYRKISSAAHSLVKKSYCKTLFVTLTFPKFKKKPTENEINKCFSNFVDNLSKTYHCQGYVAVRERGEVNHRYHFHLLCALPYTPFGVINMAWCHAISAISEGSRCALRTRKKKIFIKNACYAVRYACKYFAKSKNITSKTRIVFISNNLIKKPVRFNNEDTEFYTPQDMLSAFKSVTSKQTSDFTTMYRINDYKEFDVFCEKVLYKLFKLSDKNDKTHVMGLNSS